jgi:hypothetical protein
MPLGYNIAEFARAILGQPLIRYGSPEFGSKSQRIDYGGVKVVEATEGRRLSAMGTPIIFPITFKAGKYNIYSRSGEVVEKNMRDFALPASCIAQFRRKKIKKKTRVVASQSSVKELYGHDDWMITITGIFFDDDSHPQATDWRDQKNILMEWEELADSIEVEGELFQDLNIFRMDINEIQMTQQIGRDRVMAFQISGESDDPRDLFDL